MRKMTLAMQRTLQVSVHVFAMFWFGWHLFLAVNDQLGGDPVEALIHFSGISALQALWLSLLVSPVAKHFKQAKLMTLRRPLGLYAFFYGLAHILAYLILEIGLEWATFLEDIVSRVYISIGILGFSILFLLAVTSIPSIRRACGSLWSVLHNWVFVAASLGLIHFWLSVKSDISEPLLYSLFLVVILIPRLSYWRRVSLLAPNSRR